MSRVKMLLVEDDASLAELLAYHFKREDFDVKHTPDGEEALLLAKEAAPDIVLLDWMVEGLSGIEVCRRLRRMPETANIPIIMLTARGEEEDRVRGLETGADDYVTKPFSPRELVARVGAVLRRVRPALAGEALTYADIEMDTVGHKVRRGGEVVPLGPTEFRLLKHFLEHPGWVFSRERLLDAVWGHDSDIESRTVDVHIRRLRKAINKRRPARPDPHRAIGGLFARYGRVNAARRIACETREPFADVPRSHLPSRQACRTSGESHETVSRRGRRRLRLPDRPRIRARPRPRRCRADAAADPDRASADPATAAGADAAPMAAAPWHRATDGRCARLPSTDADADRRCRRRQPPTPTDRQSIRCAPRTVTSTAAPSARTPRGATACTPVRHAAAPSRGCQRPTPTHCRGSRKRHRHASVERRCRRRWHSAPAFSCLRYDRLHGAPIA